MSLRACKADVKTKLGKAEEDKIYKEFKRFAEYSDFKKLYHKCMPAIKGFEQKILDFDVLN